MTKDWKYKQRKAHDRNKWKTKKIFSCENREKFCWISSEIRSEYLGFLICKINYQKTKVVKNFNLTKNDAKSGITRKRVFENNIKLCKYKLIKNWKENSGKRPCRQGHEEKRNNCCGNLRKTLSWHETHFFLRRQKK